MARYRLAVLASHPVPYQSAIFRALHARKDVDLTVYFSSDFGANRESFDPEFGARIDWGPDALSGFRAVFLRNYAFRPSPGFWGQINPGIALQVASGRYDAVWVNGWNSFTNWMVFAAAMLFRVSILLRGESPLNQENIKRGSKQKIKRLLLGALFRRIEAFLYIGEENRKFYLSYGVSPEKLFFTPYAVDNERFTEAASRLAGKREALRQSLGFASGDTVFLFVGKLIGKKRPLDLLEAYSGIRSPNKKLVFVGGGVLREELSRRVAARGIHGVVMAGFQDRDSLLGYYSLADVLVLPSGQGETWGLVVNEAACFGLAVIVSDLVGCGPDLVRHGENGYVVPLGDTGAMAAAMEGFISNPARIAKAKKASSRIIAGYTIEKDAEGVIEALESLRGDGPDKDRL